jgi:hypothetical protein
MKLAWVVVATGALVVFALLRPPKKSSPGAPPAALERAFTAPRHPVKRTAIAPALPTPGGVPRPKRVLHVYKLSS